MSTVSPTASVSTTPVFWASMSTIQSPCVQSPCVQSPCVQSSGVSAYGVPVFFPKVVPSRVGSPKLVYTNGVVIKPKVYFPHQPVRNSLRGVTP
jgi:hypothetical protein